MTDPQKWTTADEFELFEARGRVDLGSYVSRRPGTRLIHAFPQGEAVVGMVQHEGRLIVATSSSLYEVVRDWPGWVIRVLKFVGARK